MKNSWTPEELEILKSIYPLEGASKNLLEKLPNRTKTAVVVKAGRMSIKWDSNPRRAWTHEEYLDRLDNQKFTCLEAYAGTTEPILHRCNTCDYEWKARPQHLLQKGAKCPECSHKDRFLSEEKVKDLLSERGFKAHSSYYGSLKPILLEHLFCGFVWESKFSYIEQGSGCPKCNKAFGIKPSQQVEKASLYLMKITLQSGIKLYKAGITVRPIKLRLREVSSGVGKNAASVELIAIYNGKGTDVVAREHKILSCNSIVKKDFGIKFDGYTEVFQTDNLQEVLKFYE